MSVTLKNVWISDNLPMSNGSGSPFPRRSSIVQEITVTPMIVGLLETLRESKDFPSPLLFRTWPCNKNFVGRDETLIDVLNVHSEAALKNHIEFHQWLRAGPRKMIKFDVPNVVAAIVTCGGLCPGLNNVIREITTTLHRTYEVKSVYGIQYGYKGFYSHDWRLLDLAGIFLCFQYFSRSREPDPKCTVHAYILLRLRPWTAATRISHTARRPRPQLGRDFQPIRCAAVAPRALRRSAAPAPRHATVGLGRGRGIAPPSRRGPLWKEKPISPHPAPPPLRRAPSGWETAKSSPWEQAAARRRRRRRRIFRRARRPFAGQGRRLCARSASGAGWHGSQTGRHGAATA